MQQQVTQVNNEKHYTSESETLLKKFLTWIKDIPEELQQQILSSFSIQQMLEFLETTLNPDKFIEDQLSSQALQEKFETEHKLYNYTSTSLEYAQTSTDMPIFLDGYTGELLNSSILLDPALFTW